MDSTLSIFSSFVAWLLRNSWQGSVLIVLVLLAQWLFRKQLSPRWRYALWLLVLVRLALPFAPESSVSVFNLAPSDWVKGFSTGDRASEVQFLFSAAPVSESSSSSQRARSTNTQEESAILSGSAITSNQAGRAVLSPPHDGTLRTSRPTNFSAINVSLILSILWLAGALLLAAFTVWFPLRLNRQLANQHSLVNPAVREVLADCQRVMNVRRVLPVVQSQAVNSPALMGFIRPWLLLPEGMLEKFTPEELRFVFLHELAHLKRRDIAVNWLMTFLLILHWFNPLVWFAFARMRADRELACDALALSYANEREAKPYGQTILKLLDGFTRPAVVAGLVGILEDQQQMKRRIAMILQFKKSSGWPVAAVALLALLGCVSLTESKKEARTKTLNQTDSKPTANGSGGLASGQTILQKLSTEKSGKWTKWITDPATRPSPDGRYLAFINWSFGNLAIHDTQTGENRDLTTDGTWDPPDQFCDSIVWSPDGKQIAYVWYKENEGVNLRIIDRNGGKPRIVVSYDKDDSMEADVWSRDGRYVVGPARRGSGANKLFQIVRVEVATGALKVLKDLPAAKGWFRVALSPADRHIAYDSGTGQLRAIDIDGSNDRMLLDNPTGAREPVWTSDGRHLVFRSDRSGTEALWALPMKEGEATEAPILVREGFFHENLWGCSADGTLYWLTQTPRANIFVADVDFAAGTIQTPRQVSLRFDGRSRHPRWSADGSTLSYVSRQFSGTKDAIHVIRETASGKERDVRIPAVYYGGFGGSPQWSADYRTLYARAVLEGNDSGGLYSFDAQSGKPTLISKGDVGTPNLSPDGSHLIYFKVTSPGTNRIREIVERDLRSGQERVIRRSGNIPVGPNPLLSHDGFRLAYLESDGTNGASLQIISRADGATKTVWENVPGRRAAVLDWLPDNRRVLVSVQDKGMQQLYLVDTETKSARPFASPMDDEGRLFQVSIHPDSKRIAFWREGTIKEVWMMKNLLPQEKLAAK